jgi:hypothetical protein
MCNIILSAIKYLRESKNVKYGKVKFDKPSWWNGYRYLNLNDTPLVCFKDDKQRSGNFFYAYPNINLQMTFFASKGVLKGDIEEISKMQWIILYLKKVK